ncbi:MAG: hypothetical protein AAFR65_10425 [Pseudomonadota bacterium]
MAEIMVTTIRDARRVHYDFCHHGMTKDGDALERLHHEGLLSKRRCNAQDRDENDELEKGDSIYEWTPRGLEIVEALTEPLGG